ncbi:ABC transporter G family member 20 [Populus alba x Populus x berolinensis]|nr:ABC transporter G family member 20 [Populus alba x Populus x berolinensis]
MSGLGHPNMSRGEGFFPSDNLPLFNHNNRMELQQYPRRSKPSLSPTLGELLKRVEDAQSDTSLDSTPVHHHQALELGYACSSMPPSSPFVLSFNNLTYSVKVGQNMPFPACGKGDVSHGSSETASMKVLLNDISGEAREGEIMAVLGASGSGKSTLIDALADRIAKESLKGSVTLNGEVLESRLLKVISAYVMQDDLLFPMLTVEETLMFSADFRLPRSLSRSKKKARVQALIDQLGLRNAANTVIGDEGHRGVSGGERRRVSIGTDIVHDPILLFLDEPTSGLDSTSAFMVVKVLQRIARSGSIVIMSVHQPSYRILTVLDSLIFLSHGQTVYGGSPGGLPDFFGQFGHPIPENENRTEFALDLIRELEEAPDGTKTLVEFNKSWQTKKNPTNRTCNLSKLSLKDAISASISRGKLVSGAPNNSNSTSSVPTFANPLWAEMMVLSKRSLLNAKRMPELFGIRLGAVLVTGVVSHVMLGFTIVVAILAYFLLFSGFFISRDRMPSYWIWFHYISLVKYPYEAALQNEFHDPTKCFVRGSHPKYVRVHQGTPKVINDYDHVFSENGLVAHKDGKLIGTQSLKSFLGDEKLKEFINFTLHYIADLDIPIKRIICRL